MRNKYGTTWWGKQWLNALNNIDYSNRLPRGRSYANKGAVTQISLDANIITAKVQGSRRKPYKVDLFIPAFRAHEKAEIIGIVTSNPLFLSQLLNRRLPSALYQACADQGIDIFPRSWEDIQGKCSCPDWAVPCKHLASVLYLVANEIDKDPFRVFELHDFNLLKGLEGIGFSAQDQKEIPILMADHLRQPIKGERKEITHASEFLDQLDFTQIPDCEDEFLTLLEENPVFYPSGNFSKILNSAYKQIAKSARKITFQTNPGHKHELIAITEVELMLGESGTMIHAQLRNSRGELLLVFKDFEKLKEWLLGVPGGRLLEYSPALRGLWLAWRFSVKLAEHSAFIPQLLRIDHKYYSIRWIAATLQESVRDLFDLLDVIIPKGLLFYKIADTFSEPTEEDALHSLVSVFLNSMVHDQMAKDYRWQHEEISRMFFTGTFEYFQSFSTQAYPSSIQLWLNKFYLLEKTYIPVLQVEEVDDEFLVNLLIEDSTNPLNTPIPLTAIFDKNQYQKIRIELLRDLAMLVDHFPQLSILISSQGKESLQFDSVEFVEILFRILPVIRLFGIKVLLPKALKKLLRPQISLALESEGETTVTSLLSLEQMLQFQWQIAIGDQMLSPQEFLKMLKQYAGIVRLQDQYVYFDEKEIQSLLDKLKDPPQLDGHQLLQAALTESYEGARVSLDAHTRKLIDDLLNGESVEVPKGLQAKLRPYQLRGYEWLYKNSRIGFGSLIADDMGLGKTIQVIATLLKLKEAGDLGEQKALIIVPTTLLTNWEKEIHKFAPGLRPHIYHGPNRDLAPLKDADILITTYGVLRSEGAKLQKKSWIAVIIDEAQHIKNPGTAQTKAVKKIKAPVKIAMSGTPVENRMSEYWSIFDFANQGFLGKLKPFIKEYAKPIEVDRDQKKLQKFKQITEPFILRRLKSDKSIIQDLPDKIEQDQFCELSKEQAALYQNVLDSSLNKLDAAEGINRQGLVLKLITALKQVCNHPKQFLKKGEANPAVSGKSQRLLSLIEGVLDQGDKALIFTQYKQMGLIIGEMLNEQFGLEIPFLHGGVSRKKRDEMVEEFQQDASSPILLLSLKAGGTGLNLTAANHIIHYDLWWNPAVEAQATDRAYRIGQKKNVQVHRFVTQGTFEEKINQMLQHKKELADLTVNTGEKWVGDLSNKEFRELVSLGNKV